MQNNRRLNNIIEALSRHEDSDAVAVLEEVGTNCEFDEVRRLTSAALVKRNTKDSLEVVIQHKGKGINDLSTNVAMNTINELLTLEDKSIALDVLDRTQESELEEEIKGTARSVKALMELS